MQCEQCGHRTEVLETTQKGQNTNRRRQCLQCGHRFTTRELPVSALASLGNEDEMPGWLKRLAGHRRKSVAIDVEAIWAGVRVERRRRAIQERQREAERDRIAELREAGLDDQAAEIEQEQLRRELEGY